MIKELQYQIRKAKTRATLRAHVEMQVLVVCSRGDSRDIARVLLLCEDFAPTLHKRLTKNGTSIAAVRITANRLQKIA